MSKKIFEVECEEIVATTYLINIEAETESEAKRIAFEDFYELETENCGSETLSLEVLSVEEINNNE